MADKHDGNEGTASTTWGWRYVKIAPAPQAKSDAERSESALGSLLPWPRRKPIHLEIRWRGGPECWYEIRARGRTIRRPGSIALHDLIEQIARWQRG